MGEALEEQVLLIKYGPGGQSLYVNFRPPSAGDAAQGNEIKPEDVGGQYRGLVGYVHETLDNLKTALPRLRREGRLRDRRLRLVPGLQRHVRAETGRREYGKNLVCLIKDLRKEFKAPKMKVVVGVMGVNGVQNEVGKQKDVRDGHALR